MYPIEISQTCTRDISEVAAKLPWILHIL